MGRQHEFFDQLVSSVQALQEAIQGREVGHTHEPLRLTQFALLAHPHFGFAKGQVLVAHQAENSWQLRVLELVPAERLR